MARRFCACSFLAVLAEEGLANDVGCHLVYRCRCTGVDGQGHSRVGVAEASLCRLHIDAPSDESGGVQTTEIVEAGTLTTGGLGGREPDPASPVRVAQRPAEFVGE